MTTENAAALDVIPYAGRQWVALDSLVDLLHDMASGMDQDKEPARSLLILARTFASGVPGNEQPRQKVQARRCADCKATVVDLPSPSGDSHVLDTVTDPRGAWMLCDTNSGAMVVPWRPHLDGVDGIRLSEHECGAR